MIWLTIMILQQIFVHKSVMEKYEKNQKLPKQTELAITYKTSRVTIQKALNLLQVEGIIYAKKALALLSVKPILPSIITPE